MNRTTPETSFEKMYNKIWVYLNSLCKHHEVGKMKN